MSKNRNKRRKEGKDKNGKSDIASKENPFSQGSPPKVIGYFIWFLGVQRYISEKIPNKLFRSVWYVTIVLIVVLSIATGIIYKKRDTGQFQYQASSLGWGTDGPKSIEVQFKANVQNISDSPRYLKNFIVVLWNEKSSGNPWLYTLPSEYGEVSFVEGATITPVALPLKFDTNEEKILAWSFSMNASEEIMQWYRTLLTEEKCINLSEACGKACAVVNRNNNSILASKTFFGVIKVVNTPNSSTTLDVQSPECTTRQNELAILMMDTRGNVFDGSGKLQSLDVMYLWWTSSNNRTIPQKLVGSIKIYLQILYWKLNAMIPNPK